MKQYNHKISSEAVEDASVRLINSDCRPDLSLRAVVIKMQDLYGSRFVNGRHNPDLEAIIHNVEIRAYNQFNNPELRRLRELNA